MVNRIGAYLNNDLRPKIQELAQTSDIWNWEKYHAKVSGWRESGLIGASRIAIFFISIIVPILAFPFFKIDQHNRLQKFLLAVDIVLLFLIILVWLHEVSTFHAVTKP